VSVRYLALDVCSDYGINPDTEWEQIDPRVKAEMLEKRRLDIDYEHRKMKEAKEG